METKTYKEHFMDVEKLENKYPTVIKNLKDILKNATDSEIDIIWNMVNIESWKRPLKKDRK